MPLVPFGVTDPWLEEVNIAVAATGAGLAPDTTLFSFVSISEPKGVPFPLADPG